MKRVIKHSYLSYTEGCGCCSNSSSLYDVWEDGFMTEYDMYVAVCENESDLRGALSYLEPFDIDPDSEWF